MLLITSLAVSELRLLDPAKIPWLASASRRSRYLIGVSGGADSVALLHLLLECGFQNLIVCHLDHCLRGGESTGDARFVARLAEKLGLQSEIGSSDVKVRIKDHSESLETAARNARHEFFTECARKHRCRRVILAHHADDQAETVLWNLLRGSHGLRGMREERGMTVAGIELRIIRPLLDVRHAALVDWLKAHRHRWREDASNLEAVAIRNRLRNEVFPLLDEISGKDAVAAFARGAHDAVERGNFENDLIRQANVLDPQGRLHLPVLRSLAPYLQRAALHAYLADHGTPSIDRALIDRAMELMDPAAAACINLPGGNRLRRREARLWIDLENS